MAEMKNSNIEWIGQIPNDWEVGKIKNFILNYGSGGTPTSANGNFYNDSGIPWVVIADMTKNPIIYNTAKKLTQKGIEDKDLQIYPKNTVLYAMYASVGKVSELGIDATVNQAILALTFDKNKINIPYIKYFLNTWEPYIKSESNGTTQFNLNANKVLNLSILYPKIATQTKIADYLDDKCDKIDRLIDNENKAIEKLKEYKQAVITEAVTKGLDKSVPLKDSGIDWIGKIPQHWQVLKLKYLFGIIGSGATPISSIDSYYNGNNNWLQTGDLNDSYIKKTNKHLSDEAIKNTSSLKLYSKGSIVIAMYGATIGKVGILDIDSYTNQACCILENPININEKYVYYWFLSNKDNIIKLSYGGGQPNINKGIILNLPISISRNKIEQDKIINYLDKKCEDIDKLISLKQQKIDKLTEYKKSLIYEYVTGKKEVQ